MIDLKKIKKEFVMQQGQSDCGVACLLSLIKFNGGFNSLEILRELSGTNRQGTTLLGLCQAANTLGFKAEGCEGSTEVLTTHGQPVILHVLMDGQLEHYVVCYGYENERFIIGDPAKGIMFYSATELDKIWISNYCLVLEITEKFEQTKDLKKLKREWLLTNLKDDFPVLIVSIVTGIAITILGMTMAVFSQRLIDELLPAHDSKKLILGLSLVGMLLLLRVGLTSIRQSLLIRQSRGFNSRIINSFYATLLNLRKSFFDTRKIGELTARLNDAERIQKVIGQLVGNVIIDGITALTAFVFIYLYSVPIGLIATISLPVYFLIIYRFNKRISSSQKQVMGAYAYNEANYINSMQGIAVIKNFGRQKFFASINQRIYGSYQDKILALGKINVKLSLLAGIAGVIFLAVILGFASFEVYNGKLRSGELMAIIGIASSLLPSVAGLALISIPFNEARIAFERMFEFVNIEPEKSEGSCIDKFNSLELTNISFRFPGRKQILSNVSMRVCNNEFVSIVGESGSGKSTLGQIIQRFYEVESGELLLNRNHKLNEHNLESWRNMLGVVPQDIHLFNGTVLDNICLDEASAAERENIVTYCKEMGFDAFIEQLPQSYATIIGEAGINLSGGQKQIIALARVLYRKPKLLLLDEATAAMDRVTERFVIELLLKLKKEIAVIFISHRIHLLKSISDRTYVLENGRVAAAGTHDELICTSNLYSDYWTELSYA